MLSPYPSSAHGQAGFPVMSTVVEQERKRRSIDSSGLEAPECARGIADGYEDDKGARTKWLPAVAVKGA